MFRSLVLFAILVPAIFVTEPAAADPRGDQLDGKLYAAAERLEQVIEDYNEARDDLRVTRGKQAALAARTRPLERAAAAQEARIGMIAATEYRNSGAGPALAVITSTSPEDFADRLLVLDRLANRRKQIEQDIAQLERLRERSGYRPSTGIRGFKPVFSAGQAGAAVRFAYAQLGKRYSYGAEGPDAYDCSGLTSAAWSRAGVALPHNARRQQRTVHRVSRSELRPGDLVFYYRNVRHVGMYVGGGKMIHAPQHGEPVRIDNIDYQPVHSFGRPG